MNQNVSHKYTSVKWIRETHTSMKVYYPKCFTRYTVKKDYILLHKNRYIWICIRIFYAKLTIYYF